MQCMYTREGLVSMFVCMCVIQICSVHKKMFSFFHSELNGVVVQLQLAPECYASGEGRRNQGMGGGGGVRGRRSLSLSETERMMENGRTDNGWVERRTEKYERPRNKHLTGKTKFWF